MPGSLNDLMRQVFAYRYSRALFERLQSCPDCQVKRDELRSCSAYLIGTFA